MKLGFFLGLQWLRGRADRRMGEEVRDEAMKLLVTPGLEGGKLREAFDRAGPAAPGHLPGSGPGVPVPDLSHLPEDVKHVLRDTDAYSFETPQEELVKHMVEARTRACARAGAASPALM